MVESEVLINCKGINWTLCRKASHLLPGDDSTLEIQRRCAPWFGEAYYKIWPETSVKRILPPIASYLPVLHFILPLRCLSNRRQLVMFAFSNSNTFDKQVTIFCAVFSKLPFDIIRGKKTLLCPMPGSSEGVYFRLLKQESKNFSPKKSSKF